MENSSNVLFVDAETSVLESIKRMLMDNERSAFFASSVEEAMETLSSHSIDTLFVDITSGNLIDLLEKVQDLHPNIVKVVISDFSHLTIIINSIRRLNLHSFLLKPWKKQELLETLKSTDEYAKFLKLQTREKENLEQKNVIYQRIINFKDDVGESNKADINSLKTSLFLLAGEYEKLIKNPDNKDMELSLRALYNASEIYTSAFPSFIEKFQTSEILNSMSLANLSMTSTTGDFVFVKNLTLLREYISRTHKFITSFLGAGHSEIVMTQNNENLVITLTNSYDINKKQGAVLFFEYLRLVLKTDNIELKHEIRDDGTLLAVLTL